MKLYELEYKYPDEDEFHYCLMVYYDEQSGLGELLDEADQEDDFSKVDKKLFEKFGLYDEDICYYYDGELSKKAIESAFEIEVKNMEEV